MSIGIFDLNDSGIQVFLGAEPRLRSPGYAVLDDSKLYIGEAAMANARLLPRWTNNRFWDQLTTESIHGATGTIRHHADLAFAHLEHLWNEFDDKPDEVVFAVPGTFQQEQLGLILGMSNECGIPLTGLVDSALAAVSEQIVCQKVLHLDIQLHATVLSLVELDHMITRRQTVRVVDVGLFKLWDRWANIIANQFIQTTRFDPMHRAESEQKLFDKLPGWIETFETDKPNLFDLALDDSTHSISVSSEQLLAACSSIYPQIVQQVRGLVPASQSTQLFLSHRLRGFPGLTGALSLLPNCEVIQLEADAISKSVLQHREDIITGTDSLSFVLALPANERSLSIVKPLKEETRATHLLYQHRAIAIGSGFKLSNDVTSSLEDLDNPQCTIYHDGNELILSNHQESGTQVNDALVMDSQAVNPGDQIHINGETVTLICVS